MHKTGDQRDSCLSAGGRKSGRASSRPSAAGRRSA